MTYRRRDTVPVPFLVSPTGRFDGNDGNWSTFDLKVGSPNQEFRVLVSTSGEISWLPSAAGCVATSESGPLPPNCPDLRGVDSSAAGASLTGYNDTISTSKSPVGTDQIPLNADLTFDEAFGSEYNISATILQDNFQLASGLGSGVQPIQHEAVFAEVTPFDLFTGSLGLGVGNVTNQIKSTPTFLESLVQAGTIPSRSWGYTAGASYRGNGGYAGNLVLGGYDQSRFSNSSTPASFNMPQSIDQSTLRVSLTSIQLGSWSPTTTPITVILDSTLPYFYLPGDIVENLVQHLGLQYDDATDLYLVNDTQRTNNKNSINTVTLIFNDLTNGDISSSVALSYAAFDLVATFPIYDNATAYFPIRKAQNGNNILGRVLFQESYVFANYEQRNFSIVQATFEDRAPQPNLIPIYSNNFNPTPPGSSKSSGIGGGAIAGIVIGVIAALAIAAGLFWWFFWRKRRQRALKKELKQREFEETEAERRRRETMTSVGSGTMVTDEGTMVSHELDTLSPTDGRPGHSRHLSELSSDSEVTRVGQKPRTSAIYELEAGGDVAAWEQNAQRVNEPQAQAQERSPTPTSPLRMSQVPSDLGESPTSPLRTTQIPSDLGEREREREGHRES